MKVVGTQLTASPTDLANFLACRHKTVLDLLEAQGLIPKPTFEDPLAEVLQKRGMEHERRYVASLGAECPAIVDLTEGRFDDDAPARTLEAMRAGADVIVQAALEGDGWRGYADVLRKVPVPSPAFGAWSYEALDTKLSRETRGGTMLQLCVYTELLGQIQQHTPEHFHVVTPIGTETYRFDDFGAFYRQAKARFLGFVAEIRVGRGFSPASSPALKGRPTSGNVLLVTYPELVDHCAFCKWFQRCNAERRVDDHLSFVAGIGRHHRTELVDRGIPTLASFAKTPIPLEFTPKRGASETYEKLREQARLQFEQRESGRPVHELLPVNKDFGLTQLPEPRPGDLFLDLEGDPFGRPGGGPGAGEGGREYLFGLMRVGGLYTARWSFTDTDERAAFDRVMTDIMAALEADPSIHVYHYGAYESSTFKRLMGRHAAREADVDRLLRGRRFVDLYAIVRHALRAGVESYSIKSLEQFYGFTRDVALGDAGDQRRIVELALETNDFSLVTPGVCAAVEGYNKDDCRSTLELRRWLESLRDGQIAKGAEIPRPPLEPDEAPERVSDRQQRVDELRSRLLTLANVPTERAHRTPDQHARHLLAHLLDWHHREDKVGWWEFYRLCALSDDELVDEPAAVAGLALVERLGPVLNKKGTPTGSIVDRYSYPQQECDIGEGSHLKLRDESSFGTVVASDRLARTFDIQKRKAVADVHPSSAFEHERYSADAMAESLYRLGEAVASGGFEAAPRAAVDLLFGRTPRLGGGEAFLPSSHPSLTSPEESASDYAVRIVGVLDNTTLPIQGPPGSGKTYTGGRMICELVKQGKRVGVTATSHKVIRNLLCAVQKEAAKQGLTVTLGHKVSDSDENEGALIVEFTENDDALNAIASGAVHVLGGTAWLWSRPESAKSVDVLFVDEAGQISLANALAVSQAASSLVLLGDPQQLEQPQRGSHPDGVDVSALDHVLAGHKTMPAERGLFLPITWRLAPEICEFTSEVFYEGKLTSKPGLERQRLTGTGRFDGSGLFVVEVEHDGCRNASDAEAGVVTDIIGELLQPGVEWIDVEGKAHQMTAEDILVVAPYNAHVARLQAKFEVRTSKFEVPRIGTVDKFQGQEAPVVIYSMATSRPEDAPRGLEFLYSLNRLNVATSRARCACVLVLSPWLFEPECRTPRQMQLANALARYREIASGGSMVAPVGVLP